MKSVLSCGVGAFFLLSCAGRAPTAVSAETSAASEQTVPEAPLRSLPDGSWQEVVLGTQALVVSLPDRKHWRELGARGSWSGLEHEPSGSQLWFRHRVARRTVTAAECEKQARTSLSLLREPGHEAVVQRLSAPAGYLGEQRVSILDGERGQVFAFGAGVSRCYAAVFVSDNDSDLPQRLALASERIFAAVRLVGLDERGLGTRFGEE